MTVAEAIKHATASVVILAEVTARMFRNNWVLDGTLTNTYKLYTPITDVNGKVHRLTVTGVIKDNATALTARASAAAVEASNGWYHDGDYLWVRPVTGTIFAATYQPQLIFYFADKEKVLNSLYWEPRLLSAPAISQRIEPIFGDVSQIGGGSISLSNNDGFLDSLKDLQWDAGSVTLKLGVDLPGGAMAWADYVTLATWLVESWSNDGDTFQFKLGESKSKVKAKIPFDVFTRDDYPSIEDDIVGQPIPIAYGANFGVSPVLISPGTKTFKVAGHAIRSFDGVRLKKTRAEVITRSTTTTVDWLDYDTDVKRYYLADETVKKVTFKGQDLTEQNDVDDLVAGEWAYAENYVYAFPPSGYDWSAGTVTVESEISVPQLTTTDFATVDAANGEFTLGDDWAVGIDVAVDFRGKVEGGVYLENAIDIIEDLLTLAGETNLNSSAFTEARSRLSIGTDEFGREINTLRPSLYITELTEVLELIGEVNKLARSFLFSDETGQYSVGVFEPEPGEDLPQIDDTQIIEFDRLNEVSDLITKVIARYEDRPVDGYAQTATEENTAYQHIRNQPNPVTETVDLLTAYESDAEYWAQAYLILKGTPLVKLEVKAAWSQMLLAPGDQVHLISVDRGIDEVMEVLEKRLNLGDKGVTLILGNLRGFEDSPGTWIDDADVLPTRFAQLSGYSAGAPEWNSSWDDEISSWARQNFGYWTDDNGFADPADARSYNLSAWV